MSTVTPAAAAVLSPGEKVTLALFAVLGLIIAGWVSYRSLVGPAVEPPPPLRVGEQARAFLRENKSAALTGSLTKLLRDPGVLVLGQPHPLDGKLAPDFALNDHQGRTWRLADELREGPVVLVFYYGYHCDHCVSQLFDLNEDIAYFQELGARVLAVSGDPPLLTAAKMRENGAFRFPVLSDPGNIVAERYGCFTPARRDGSPARQSHGTFVIGRDGKIVWVNTGDTPFTGNPTLLVELAKLENRMPATADDE